MKKILALLLVAAAGFVGYRAYAQNEGITVGNPDSDNLLMVEEGYAVVTPEADPAVSSDTVMEGVNMQPQNDVIAAPVPSPASSQPAMSNPPAPLGDGNNMAPAGGSMTIDEQAVGVQDSNGNSAYEVDETISYQ